MPEYNNKSSEIKENTSPFLSIPCKTVRYLSMRQMADRLNKPITTLYKWHSIGWKPFCQFIKIDATHHPVMREVDFRYFFKWFYEVHGK